MQQDAQFKFSFRPLLIVHLFDLTLLIPRPATTMTARGAYDLSEDYESVFEEYSKEGDAR